MNTCETVSRARATAISVAPVTSLSTAFMTIQDQVVLEYEKSRQDVYHYLLKLGLDPCQSQEAAQEVFLRFYVALSEGETIRDARAWIFRVAHNLGQNLSIKRKRWLTLDAASESTIRDQRPGPEEDAIGRQRDKRIYLAVASLSPQQRRCLHLRGEGLRYHQIAATLGIGVSTVGVFLSRAVARIRKALDEQP